MRFLADENFPGSAVDTLRTAGREVVWIRTLAPGSSDREVLAMASQEQRILLTFDKDFGELAKSVVISHRLRHRTLADPSACAGADWQGSRT